MTSRDIIKRLLSKGLIQIDSEGFYQCSNSSTPNTTVTINYNTKTLRQWIYRAIYGRFPTSNLRTINPSMLIDWRLTQ